MKKIIQGKLYNTDTARKLAHWESDLTYNDLKWSQEDLYRTKSGAYFIHGQGGAMSRYAQPAVGGGWGSGELIWPIPLDEAQDWAEERLAADEYQDIFGPVDEASDTRERLNLYVGSDTKATLQRMSQEQGRSISQIVDDLVANR